MLWPAFQTAEEDRQMEGRRKQSKAVAPSRAREETPSLSAKKSK